MEVASLIDATWVHVQAEVSVVWGSSPVESSNGDDGGYIKETFAFQILSDKCTVQIVMVSCMEG